MREANQRSNQIASCQKYRSTFLLCAGSGYKILAMLPSCLSDNGFYVGAAHASGLLILLWWLRAGSPHFQAPVPICKTRHHENNNDPAIPQRWSKRRNCEKDREALCTVRVSGAWQISVDLRQSQETACYKLKTPYVSQAAAKWRFSFLLYLYIHCWIKREGSSNHPLSCWLQCEQDCRCFRVGEIRGEKVAVSSSFDLLWI